MPAKAGWDKAAQAHLFLITLEEPVRPLHVTATLPIVDCRQRR